METQPAGGGTEPERPPQRPRFSPPPFIIGMLLLLLLAVLWFGNDSANRITITYGQFREALAQDHIAEVLINEHEVRGKLKPGIVMPPEDKLQPKSETEKSEASKGEAPKGEAEKKAQTKPQPGAEKKSSVEFLTFLPADLPE